MGGRWKAGHLVHQKRPEGRARLDLGIPVLQHRMPVPIHVADVVEATEMRSGGEIAGMGLMGLGGLVAIAGGLLFVVLMVGAARRGRE